MGKVFKVRQNRTCGKSAEGIKRIVPMGKVLNVKPYLWGRCLRYDETVPVGILLKVRKYHTCGKGA